MILGWGWGGSSLGGQGGGQVHNRMEVGTPGTLGGGTSILWNWGGRGRSTLAVRDNTGICIGGSKSKAPSPL